MTGGGCCGNLTALRFRGVLLGRAASQAVDPEGRRKLGDVVCFGDVILLVDDRSLVWHENVSQVCADPEADADAADADVTCLSRRL